MKYYFGSVTTRYNEMEWEHYFLIEAENIQSAHTKADQIDWTHRNKIEYQDEAQLQEIPRSHFETLKTYLSMWDFIPDDEEEDAEGEEGIAALG